MKHTIPVEIYDQVYHLAAEGSGGPGNDDEYVLRLAARVDGVMRQIARQTRVVDSLRVAVLAAVNFADENEALRARCRQLERSFEEKTSHYHHLLDRALGA